MVLRWLPKPRIINNLRIYAPYQAIIIVYFLHFFQYVLSKTTVCRPNPTTHPVMMSVMFVSKHILQSSSQWNITPLFIRLGMVIRLIVRPLPHVVDIDML